MADQEITKKEKYLLRQQQKEKEQILRVCQRKIKKIISLALPIILITGGILFWLNYSPKENQNNTASEKPKITVFYSPTCPCCKEYLPYLRRNGFEVEAKETRDMLFVKEQYQIPSDLESCHTAVIGNYFVEGHIPVEAIKKLLEEKPEILGISLPGMPQGSPGMGGVKREIFKIYGLSKAGEILEFLNL